ncbi:hypothetical protein MES4922_140080 [Mesorhizobium ventifaucium]|uniref:Uncharacterized protein n=1 Tax=Mesorhizobium ventifaucium TaxID=666020 RepID=A0ABM9DHJ6_9HYPH|nr:hypothetical protein MES4922_140080 [Mesorhizobium ventifaucium]
MEPHCDPGYRNPAADRVYESLSGPLALNGYFSYFKSRADCPLGPPFGTGALLLGRSG